MSGLIYSAHQPDLLPYSGFFYKLAKADVFDLKIWDQYVNRGYQRRVMMRGRWANLPLQPGSSTDSIFDKLVKPEAAAELADTVRLRYGSKAGDGVARFWDHEDRGQRVLDEILSIKTDRLWEFNFRLIMLMRDMLGIETPLALGRPVREGLRGSEGLISAMLAFPKPLTYLSGTGAKKYMGDCAEFTAEGIPVVFSKHEHVTGDSILTVLFDYEDPMSVVLRETNDQEQVEAS
jgi:hypothetical protein